MLRHVLFDTKLFDGEADRANSQKRILWLLEALTQCNQLYLQNHPDTPLIYASGIKYIVPAQFESTNVPEVETIRTFLQKNNAPQNVINALDALYNIVGGGEIFREIPRIIENGGGDCDNVACWRAAELRQLGIAACPFITWRKRADGGMTYHVIVRWPDNTIEDPSLLLGMGSPGRNADREEEERKLGERTAMYIAALKGSPAQRAAAEATAASVDMLGARTKQVYLSGLATTNPTRVQGVGAINSPQNYNQLQYTIPFQTDDVYENWSPTRPQAYFFNPLYPNLPTTPGGGPIFNTRLRDPDDDDFEDRYESRHDRFDGALSKLKRIGKRVAKAHQ
jgi:hypothetical protein